MIEWWCFDNPCVDLFKPLDYFSVTEFSLFLVFKRQEFLAVSLPVSVEGVFVDLGSDGYELGPPLFFSSKGFSSSSSIFSVW
jgi:hypothetical protein